MVFWQKKRPRSLRCFYCNEKSIVSHSANLKDWTCPLCDALNILDKDGTIADSIPQEYQQIALQSSTSPETKHTELSTPFCSVCTSNQALLIKTLANYYPADDDPDVAIYEKAYPAYKASLEERYPPVCTSCAPTIEARLHRNNYIAKSTALGNWLRGAKSSSRPLAEMSPPRKCFLTFIWVLRGFLWWGASIVMLLWYTIGTVIPASQKFGMDLSTEQRVSSTSSSILDLTNAMSQAYSGKLHQLMKWWFPIALLGTFWTSKTLTTIWNTRTRIQGKREHRKLQVMIQVMRAITIYALPTQICSVKVYQRLSAFLLFVSVVHLVCSLHMLTVSDQTRVDLKGASTSLRDPFIDQTDAQAGRASETVQQAHKFLDRPLPNEFLTLSDDENEEREEEQVVKEADSMDWQPQQDVPRISGTSPFTNAATTGSSSIPRMFPQPVFAQPREQYFSSNPAHRSPFRLNPTTTSEPIRLARQKFFAPEKPTGLENLFSAAVTLDDEPLLVRSIKSVQRTPTFAAWLSFVATSVLAVPLGTGHLDILAIIGSTVALIDVYLSLLPKGTTMFVSVLFWPLVWATSRVVRHYNFPSRSRESTIISMFCVAFALHLALQGWVLYTALRKRKRQGKPHARGSKKRV